MTRTSTVGRYDGAGAPRPLTEAEAATVDETVQQRYYEWRRLVEEERDRD